MSIADTYGSLKKCPAITRCPLFRVSDFLGKKRQNKLRRTIFSYDTSKQHIWNIFQDLKKLLIALCFWFLSFIFSTFSINSLKTIFKWSLPLTSMKFFAFIKLLKCFSYCYLSIVTFICYYLWLLFGLIGFLGNRT